MRRPARPEPSRPRRRREAGGLLIVLMVGVTVIFIGLSVAVQAWSVVWRRDSEEELIFRGEQYVIAILAYRKEHNGQFPTDLEILAKEGPRRVRYIRKLFRDPINPTGQWGLLYLMPTGNAIYDPVAAQKTKPADGSGGSDALGASQGGVTPIGDLMGTGAGFAGANAGIAAPNAPGGAQGAAGNVLKGSGPVKSSIGGGANPTGARAPFMQGSWSGGALPAPKPASGSFDEDAPSEPPIGWPIVGVISRADTRLADKTFKIHKGKDKIDQWQFHVFDQTLEVATPAATPGGSPAPFGVGPSFGGGGRGKIFQGIGGGAGQGGGRTPRDNSGWGQPPSGGTNPRNNKPGGGG